MTRIFSSAVATGQSKRIMVYSGDAYDLEDIQQILTICDYLLKSIPNLSILLLSGSPMLRSFRLPKGLHYVKLPYLNQDSLEEMKVKYLNTDIESTSSLRSEIILVAAKNYQPNLVLVDKKPLGIQGELNSTIDYLKRGLPNTRFILLLRDILGTPKNIIREWKRENYCALVESIYDRLLVLGMPEIFNVAEEYLFGKAITAKVRYCGYIRKESSLKNQQIIRQELKISSQEKLVLVLPGRGKDGSELIQNYLTGLAQRQEELSNKKIHSLILCGVEIPIQQRQQIYQQAENLSGVTVWESTHDLMSYINAADVVISLCGYHTITDILQTNKQAIIVPQKNPEKDQLIRAQSLEKLGLLTMIYLDDLQPDLLIQSLLFRLEVNQKNTWNDATMNHLDFAGLSRVYAYVSVILFNSFRMSQGLDMTLQSA